MKIKSNIRAGQGANAGGVNAGGTTTTGGATGGHSSQINNTVVSIVPASSRCVGL